MRCALVWLTTLAGCLITGSVVAGDRLPPRLIDAIRANEAKYDNVETKWRLEYFWLGTVDTRPETVFEMSSEAWDVAQGGKCFQKLAHWEKSEAGGKYGYEQVAAFDSNRTRFLRGNNAATYAGRLENSQFLKPHTALFRLGSLSLPLADLLASGSDAIAADRQLGKSFYTDLILESEYGGQVTVGDYRTEKVTIRLQKKGGDGKPVATSATRTLWLAVDRNYLPVKSIAFSLQDSEAILLEEGAIESMNEIAPGLWFPTKIVLNVYDETSARNGNMLKTWHNAIIVDEVSIDPMHPDSFFEIDYPDGTNVREIDLDGNTVRRYVQGEKPN